MVSQDRQEKLRPHVANDAKRGRHVVQHLGDVLAQRPERAATSRADAGGRVLDDVARQVCWKRPPCWLGPCQDHLASAPAAVPRSWRCSPPPGPQERAPVARSPRRASPTSDRTAAAAAWPTAPGATQSGPAVRRSRSAGVRSSRPASRSARAPRRAAGRGRSTPDNHDQDGTDCTAAGTFYPAISGCHVRTGIRQSIPSSSIDS